MSYSADMLAASGQYLQGSGASRAADLNADLQDAKGLKDAAAIRRLGPKQRGAIRAAAGKAGVEMSGSARLVMEEAITNNISDAIQVEYNAKRAASMERLQGRLAKSAATTRAAGMLLSGAVSAYGDYKASKKPEGEV